ncbi:AMP-binding protein [bacterium SCSIO 12643]|nr:AMP-binding protein [bacterium SCSIO 12643]
MIPNTIILNGTPYDIERCREKIGASIPDWEKDIFHFLIEWFSDSTEIEIQTSGSTGQPKKIKRTKQSMINSALMTGKFLGLQDSSKALLCLPSKYIAGKMMLVRAITLGLQMDYVAPQNSIHIIGKYDFCAMTPSQVEASFDHISSIKKLIIGGAPISQKLEFELKSKTSSTSKIYATYGMTETVSHIALRKIDLTNDLAYHTLPNISISQDDRDCLVINAPKITTSTLTTNDIVDITSPTSFIWKGRFDHVINSGGVKLFPEKIEAKIESLIDAPYFISSLPDEKWGHKVVLIIESSSLDTTSLLKSVKTQLNKLEIPKEVFYIPQFQYTPNGKLNRSATMKRLHISS